MTISITIRRPALALGALLAALLTTVVAERSAQAGCIAHANEVSIPVTTVADTVAAGDGETSLREAIQSSYSYCRTQASVRITFTFDNGDPQLVPGKWTIVLDPVRGPLPALRDGTIVDGLLSTGAALNSAAPGDPWNGNLVVEIRGDGAGGTIETGLEFRGCTGSAQPKGISGLILSGFDDAVGTPAAIVIGANCDNAFVYSNWIGLDGTGAEGDNGAAQVGVWIESNANIVGDASGNDYDRRNVIRGNGGAGVLVDGNGDGRGEDNIIQANTIDLGGIGIELVQSIPTLVVDNWIERNDFEGILLDDASYTTVTGNTVLNNGADGIHILTGFHNMLLENEVDANVGLGIRSGDPSTQASPVITSVDRAGNAVTVAGTRTAGGIGNAQLQVFRVPTCDPSGHGEGRVFVATGVVLMGDANYSLAITDAAAVGGQPDHYAVTDSPDPGTFLNTSEFSNCFDNAPRVAVALVDQNATEDAAFSYTVPANAFADADEDPLTYSAAGLPAWLGFNPATRTFSGTPTNANVGFVDVTVTATGPQGPSASDVVRITVANTNDPPTLANPIADRNTNEDAAFSYQFPVNTFSDVDVGDVLTYTATGAGGVPLPAWLTFTPGTRTFSGTPLNANVGVQTIVLTAHDIAGATAVDTFLVTVLNTNDAPTVANAIPDQAGSEDVAFSFTFAANTFADVDVGDALTYSASGVPVWLGFNPGTRTFSGTPTVDAHTGIFDIQVTATDESLATASDTFRLTVATRNDPPTITAIADQTTPEDTAVAPAFTIADEETAAASLGLTGDSSNDVLVPDANLVFGGAGAARTITVTPALNQSGSTTVTVTVSDGVSTAVEPFAVTVTAVNDAPTISDVVDQTINEDANTGALAVTVGDVETAAGSLILSGSSTNTALVPNGNIVFGGAGANRTVTVTPLANQFGSTTITVTVTDGGAATAQDTFVVTVTSVNDAPTITNILDQTVTEDTPTNVLAFTIGDVETAAAALSVTASSSNTAVIPNGNLTLGGAGANRTIQATPAANQSGASTITVTVSDGTATGVDTFVVTVDAANDAPVLAVPIPDQNASEDVAFSFTFGAGTFTDADPGDVLTYSAAGLPAWLAFTPATRTFSGTPGNGDVGASTITVTAQDPSGATAGDSFVVTVANVNDAPTVVNPLPDRAGNEDVLFTFTFAVSTFGDVDAGDTLAYSASGMPAWLGFTPGTRTFSGTPLVNADAGVFDIQVTATDAALASASDTFRLTVTARNDPPTITAIADQSTPEDTAAGPVAFTVGDEETAAGALTLSGTSTNLGLVPNGNLAFGGAGANRTVTMTPALNQTGTTTITVTVSDGVNPVAAPFQLTVTAVNDAPSISDVGDQDIDEDTTTGSLAFTVGDVETAAGFLVVTAVSSNTALVPNGNITLGGAGANRTVAVTPAPDQFGATTITLTVTDAGGAIAQDPFVVTVNGINDPPTISNIADRTVPEDTSSGPLAFTIGDPETAAGALTVTATSSNPALAPDANVVLGGAGANRTVEVTPLLDQIGSTTITVTVSDGVLTAFDTFRFTTDNVNEPPTLANPVPDRNATEDAPFSFTFAANTFADVDPEDVLSYAAAGPGGTPLPAWLSFDAATRTFSGTPANADVGAYTIELTASDPLGETASDTFVITVVNTNDAPTVAAPVPDQAAAEDALFSFTFGAGTFADVDLGDTLTYSAPGLPAWLSFDPATRTFSGTAANADLGDHDVVLVATDGAGASASDTFTITVANTNDPPVVVTPIPDQTGDEDQAFSFTFAAGAFGDPDPGDTVTYGALGLPAWLSFDGVTRTFTGTPATNADAGSFDIQVVATDAAGATVVDTFTLVVATHDDPPTLSAIADQSTDEDTAAGPIGFTVGDEESAAGTLLVTGGSSNDTLVPDANVTFGGGGANRTVTVTPAPNRLGTTTITVTVSDGVNVVSTTFRTTVIGENDDPTISPIDDLAIDEDGDTGPIGFTVTDAESAAVDLVTSGASDDQSLVQDSDIVITGAGGNRTVTITPRPQANGLVGITLTVRDQDGGSAEEAFSIDVRSVDDAPTLANPIPDQVTDEDVDFVFGLAADVFADIDEGDTLTYSAVLVNGGALPDWLTFTPDTRTFDGTPANEDVGVLDIRVSAVDLAGASISDDFTLLVNDVNDAPTRVQLIPDHTTLEDEALSLTIDRGTFDDVDVGDVLTLSARQSNGDDLPDWLSFDPPTRRFLGTPEQVDVGVLDLRVTAADEAGESAFGDFTLTVENVNDAPTIDEVDDQDGEEDVTLEPIAVVVDDTDTDLDDLVVTATSSDPAIVEDAGIEVAGEGAERTLAITPVENASGEVTITVTVSDGELEATDEFVVNFASVNDPPTIEPPDDMSIVERTTTDAVHFTVGDAEDVDALVVTATSDDEFLIPNESITLGGTGADRTIVVLAPYNRTGGVTITLTVDDGEATAEASFFVTVESDGEEEDKSSCDCRSTGPTGGDGTFGWALGAATLLFFSRRRARPRSGT